MRKYFFHINWVLQLLVGIGLFCISFLIENSVLQSLFSSSAIALALAVCFEIGKATAIVWHRYMMTHGDQLYPLVMRVSSYVFRIGLVLLSLLCSVLYLGDFLDRPNLQMIRDQALAEVDSEAKHRLERLEKELATMREAHREQQAKEHASLSNTHTKRVHALETKLDKEMNNVVKGVFRGKRYRALEERLQQAQQQESIALENLTRKQEAQRREFQDSLLSYQQTQQADIRGEIEAKRQAILENDFAEDERVNNAMIVAFLKVTEAVFGWSHVPLQFVFLFSISISLLLEVGILLSFETITVSIAPLLKTQHRYAVEKEILRAKLDGELGKEGIQNSADISHISMAADQSAAKARAHYEKFRNAGGGE